jgi:hypothetical protein
MSRKVELLSDIMQEAWSAASSEWNDNSLHYKVFLTCTHRTTEEQKELYSRGRNGDKRKKVTNCDGVNKKSKHQKKPSDAFDVAFQIIGTKSCSWDKCLFEKFNNFVQSFVKTYNSRKDVNTIKIVWGGNWNSKFIDNPHFEFRKK